MWSDICVINFNNIEIDSLLQMLRSLSAHDEEVEELNALEGMLKSNTFKKAKQVNVVSSLEERDDCVCVTPNIITTFQI